MRVKVKMEWVLKARWSYCVKVKMEWVLKARWGYCVKVKMKRVWQDGVIV